MESHIEELYDIIDELRTKSVENTAIIIKLILVFFYCFTNCWIAHHGYMRFFREIL